MACKIETAKREKSMQLENAINKNQWDEALSMLKDMTEGRGFIQYLINKSPDNTIKEPPLPSDQDTQSSV